MPVTVVVPQTTTEHARALIRAQGAELIVHGAVWDEANALAQSLLGAEDAFVHPFDDPLLWTGHSTLVDELAAADFKPDAVVLAVGGGGLLAGVVQGLERHGWTDVDRKSTSELQSPCNLVCRLLLEKKKKKKKKRLRDS